MFEQSDDEHRQIAMEGYELTDADGTIYTAPAVAHRRAGDKAGLQLVPSCPICQAKLLARREQEDALKELIAEAAEVKAMRRMAALEERDDDGR